MAGHVCRVPHLKRFGGLGAQPEAGKPLKQWFADHGLPVKKRRELSNDATARGWERPKVRILFTSHARD